MWIGKLKIEKELKKEEKPSLSFLARRPTIFFLARSSLLFFHALGLLRWPSSRAFLLPAARSPWPSWRTGLLSSALLLRSAYAAPHARVCFLSLRRGTRSLARAPHAPASPFSLAASQDPPVGVTPPSHCAAGPACQRLLSLSFFHVPLSFPPSWQ